MDNLTDDLGAYGIREGYALGLSKLIREAEERGVVTLERNGTLAAAIVPGSLEGFQNFTVWLRAYANDPMSVDPRIRPFVHALFIEVERLLEERSKGKRKTGYVRSGFR